VSSFGLQKAPQKHPKSTPNNNIIFQKVEDDFNYESKHH